MKYDWLSDHLLAKPGAVKDFKVEWQWERYLVRDRMFAAVCTPDKKYKPYDGRTMVMLKCDPNLAELLRGKYADIVPGFYCDKRCWNSVYLDGSVPEEVLRELCDMSYKLVVSKLTKTAQRELTNSD